ncbi:MAG TPA: hypothetical protein VHB21_13555 [Minicystis sp.]|nr:hypothetical protein [Minicystis sp.]
MSRVARRFVAAALACVAAPACGLVSHDPELAAFPPDGVNDFGDASPVEVCLGTARVVAPSVAVGLGGALCVPDDAAAAPCSDDTACEGIERCVCGRCIVEACEGSSCEDGRVCRGNRCTTSCAKDGECAAGERCASGGCARACSRDDECLHGERCDPLEEVCSSLLCSDVIPCGAGDRCEPQQVTGDLREPELATVDGAPVGFVELRTPGASRPSVILRARIDSATRWTAEPSTPVLAGAAGEAVGAPAVLVSGSRVDLWFSTSDKSAIGHAVSNDGGRSFMRDPAPALVPADAWENGFVGSPSVAIFGGATLLAFEGGPGAGIGLARVDPDTGALARVGHAPIATPKTVSDATFWRHVTEVRAPYLVPEQTLLRVYFTGRGEEASDALVGKDEVPAPANDSIGLVATRDLETFSPYPAGPVFSRVTNLRAYLGESEAAVELAPEGKPGAAIVFVSADATGKATTGLARAGTF